MLSEDMTQEDRERLAARLLREQDARFLGVAKDAYTTAGVNSATWKRATGAESIKRHKQIQIVVKLWPETGGDWTKIPGIGLDAKLSREVEDLREAIRAAKAAGVSRDELLDAYDAETG